MWSVGEQTGIGNVKGGLNRRHRAHGYCFRVEAWMITVWKKPKRIIYIWADGIVEFFCCCVDCISSFVFGDCVAWSHISCFTFAVILLPGGTFRVVCSQWFFSLSILSAVIVLPDRPSQLVRGDCVTWSLLFYRGDFVPLSHISILSFFCSDFVWSVNSIIQKR